VIKRFSGLRAWRETECIVVGGGFRGSRVGELAIARAGLVKLQLEKAKDLSTATVHEIKLVRVPRIGDHETMVVMHNDAVVQGLTKSPYLGKAKRWASSRSVLASETPAPRGDAKRRAKVDPGKLGPRDRCTPKPRT
jgi:hypothetical protein